MASRYQRKASTAHRQRAVARRLVRVEVQALKSDAVLIKVLADKLRSESIADCWTRLSVPDPLLLIDGLRAVTAMIRGLVLVTRNTADVERMGVVLLNPFEE